MACKPKEESPATYTKLVLNPQVSESSTSQEIEEMERSRQIFRLWILASVQMMCRSVCSY